MVNSHRGFSLQRREMDVLKEIVLAELTAFAAAVVAAALLLMFAPDPYETDDGGRDGKER